MSVEPRLKLRHPLAVFGGMDDPAINLGVVGGKPFDPGFVELVERRDVEDAVDRIAHTGSSAFSNLACSSRSVSTSVRCSL